MITLYKVKASVTTLDQGGASFLNCFFISYCSSKYFNTNSCCLFFAFRSNNNKFSFSNLIIKVKNSKKCKERKNKIRIDTKREGAITILILIEKSPMLLKVIKNLFWILDFVCTNIIFADCNNSSMGKKQVLKMNGLYF